MSSPEPTPADPDSRGVGRHSHRRRGGWIGRALVAALAVVVLLGVGLEWQIKHRAEVGLAGRRIDALEPTAEPTTTAAAAVATALIAASTAVRPTTTTTTAAAPVPAAPTAAENILLLGSDTRSGSNAEVGADSSTNGVANSDVVMIAHISANRQHVTVLSIPRDTMIPAPTTCHSWNAVTGVVSDQIYPVSPGQRFHFNAGYSVGGPQCTVTEVQNLTGLRINRFIGIDFVGFQSMVDALGGITVDICAPIVDKVLGTVVPKAGVQKVTGVQALNLVRARDVIGDSLSDLARIRRQQIVLSAILRQVTEAGTLLNPAKLDNFLQAFVKNTVTDNVTIDDLVTLASSLGNLSPGVVTFYTLPTFPSTITPGALEVDQTPAQALFAAMREDRLLTVTATTAVTTPKSRASSTAASSPSKASSSATNSVPAKSTAVSVESVNAGTAQCAGPGNE